MTQLLLLRQPQEHEGQGVTLALWKEDKETQHVGLGDAMNWECYETSGTDDFSRTTSIATTWSNKSEIFRKFHCPVCSPSSAYGYLKCRKSSRRVLSHRCYNAAFTAVSNLLVIRGIWQQVNNCRLFLTAVRNVASELWTIPLICSLCSHHGPNHLILCPCPS